ncbi:cell separation during budding [Mortierella claussenii]|nr:cell separation during budding [Mortierella claussenii]
MSQDGIHQHREGLTTSHHDWTMVQVGKLVEHQTLVSIDANASVEDACEVLFKRGISSAPVYDAQRKAYVGMFDYSDLMTYILLALKKMDVPVEDQTMSMQDLIQKTSTSQNVPVKLASDLSGKDPFCTVMAETRLGAVVTDFGTGIHRVAVMDSTGKMVGILSQSSTLDYLMRHLSEFSQLQPVMQQTLQQTGLSGSKVLSVNGEAQVLEALIIMSKHSVSSLAVLDDQGVLLGNISMTDIQHIMKDLRTSWLWLSCFQFVSKVRMSRGVETGEDQYPVLDVNSKSTFGYTLSKLQATKVHRLWVVNDLGLVVGVVSLTDVYKVLSTLIDS